MTSVYHLTTLFAGATGCGATSNFLTFPTWYEYLHKTTVNGLCTPQLNSLADIWLIVAAVIEIMLRIAALVAVGYTMYGGFTYVTSQGDPGKTARARDMIVSALAGLAIAVVAAVLVGFIAGRIT
jgi:hypothetical protein